MKHVANLAVSLVLVGSAAGAVTDTLVGAALVGRVPVPRVGPDLAGAIHPPRKRPIRSRVPPPRSGPAAESSAAAPAPATSAAAATAQRWCCRRPACTATASFAGGRLRSHRGVQVRLRSGAASAPGSSAHAAASWRGRAVGRIDLRTRARTVAARGLSNPLYVAFDSEDRLAVADSANRIYRIDPDGSRKLLAGTGARPRRRRRAGDRGRARRRHRGRGGRRRERLRRRVRRLDPARRPRRQDLDLRRDRRRGIRRRRRARLRRGSSTRTTSRSSPTGSSSPTATTERFAVSVRTASSAPLPPVSTRRSRSRRLRVTERSSPTAAPWAHLPRVGVGREDRARDDDLSLWNRGRRGGETCTSRSSSRGA